MQYSKAFTEALQFMWGEGFLSPGGPEEVAALLQGLSIAGRRVLDIGSGVGGVDALLVADHGAAEVVGIDVESGLVEAASAFTANKGLSDRITFRLIEPGPLPFAEGEFDFALSKDSMVHIDDKAALFAQVLRVLKPGGWFIAADWLWSEGAASSPVVINWLSGGPLKFAFTTPAAAEQALRDAGFENVAVIDRSQILRESNRHEVEVLAGPMGERLAALVGSELAKQRLASARGRQGALDSGDLKPSHLRAQKPPRSY